MWQHTPIGFRSILAFGAAIALTLAQPLRAETLLKVADRPVLTLRTPDGQTEARATAILDRLDRIAASLNGTTWTITARGDATRAEIVANGQVLMEVTAADAAANATQQAIALAEVWVDRWQDLLDLPEVSDRLLATATLPDRLEFAGRVYVRGSQPVPDLGRFVTDGTRAGDRVLFWQTTALDDVSLPSPPPDALFVLNGSIEFIPYRLR